jgi:hypothetical protein
MDVSRLAVAAIVSPAIFGLLVSVLVIYFDIRDLRGR